MSGRFLGNGGQDGAKKTGVKRSMPINLVSDDRDSAGDDSDGKIGLGARAKVTTGSAAGAGLGDDLEAAYQPPLKRQTSGASRASTPLPGAEAPRTPPSNPWSQAARLGSGSTPPPLLRWEPKPVPALHGGPGVLHLCLDSDSDAYSDAYSGDDSRSSSSSFSSSFSSSVRSGEKMGPIVIDDDSDNDFGDSSPRRPQAALAFVLTDAEKAQAAQGQNAVFPGHSV